MKNKMSCSKCKRRAGYSAFRPASAQCGSTVRRLYELVHSVKSTKLVREQSSATLSRYGFNPQRRCVLLTSIVDELLVHNQHPVTMQREVFPCCDYRDKMHGLMIYLHRTIMNALNCISWNSRPGLRVKEILDQRLTALSVQASFREAGRSYRVQKSMFSEKDMSATDKVSVLFLLPHVFGHKAQLFPDNVRGSMVTAIARAQLMLIAARGRRQYTTSELGQIFDRGYIELFSALEQVHQVAHDKVYAAKLKKHRSNPTVNPAPKRFRSQRYVRMYVYVLTDVPHVRTDIIVVRMDLPYDRTDVLLFIRTSDLFTRTDLMYDRTDVLLFILTNV